MNLSKTTHQPVRLTRKSTFKKSLIFILLSAILVSTMAFMTSETKPDKKNKSSETYSTMLNGIKSYTIELAEAMPADKYTFRPTDSVRSFGEQMAHIGMSSKFLVKLFIEGEPMPTDPEVFANMGKMEKEIGASKEVCIKELNAGFDALIAKMESMDSDSMNEMFTVPFDPNQPEFSKAKGFEFIKDHIIHHRAQALVSLRMQGIKAPQYRLY